MEAQKRDETTNIPRRQNPPFKVKLDDKKLINPSWEEAHKFGDEAMKWVRVQEDLAKDMAIAQKNIAENMFEAFRRTPVVDCSYGESPIGPTKQIFYLKAFLKKIGWAGVTIRDVQMPEVEIRSYAEVMSEGIKWLFKLEKANEEVKKITK